MTNKDHIYSDINLNSVMLSPTISVLSENLPGVSSPEGNTKICKCFQQSRFFIFPNMLHVTLYSHMV